MANTPLGWYRWYPRDFLTSSTVRKMSYTSQGIYRALLDLQWEIGVPLTYHEATLVLRLSENERCEFESFFDVCFPDGINAKLMEQRDKQSKAIKAQSEAGKVGGKTSGKGRSRVAKGLVRGTSNQTETETETETKKSIRDKFVKPTVEEINSYMEERNWLVLDGQKFFDSYESKGWKIGKAPMKDWKATVRTWETSDWFKGKRDSNSSTPTTSHGPGWGIHWGYDPDTGLKEAYTHEGERMIAEDAV